MVNIISKIKELLKHKNAPWIITGSAILLVLIITAIVFVIINSNQNDNESSYEEPQEIKYKTLTIESSPEGLQPLDVADNCDTDAVTPIECKYSEDKTEVTLTAKSEVAKDDKIYYFDSWQGCSESNPDQKICKVFLTEDNQGLTVNYKEQPLSSGGGISKGSSGNNGLCQVSQQNGRTTCTIDYTEGVEKNIVIQQIYNGKSPLDSVRSNMVLACSPESNCQGTDRYWKSKVLDNAVINLSFDNEGLTVHCGIGGHFCGPPEMKYHFNSIYASQDDSNIFINITSDYICTNQYESVSTGDPVGSGTLIGCFE